MEGCNGALQMWEHKEIEGSMEQEAWLDLDVFGMPNENIWSFCTLSFDENLQLLHHLKKFEQQGAFKP